MHYAAARSCKRLIIDKVTSLAIESHKILSNIYMYKVVRIKKRMYKVAYWSLPVQHLSLTFFKKNQSKFTPLLSKITLRL